MKDKRTYAILFQKINLGNNKFAFKPIKIINGNDDIVIDNDNFCIQLTMNDINKFLNMEKMDDVKDIMNRYKESIEYVKQNLNNSDLLFPKSDKLEVEPHIQESKVVDRFNPNDLYEYVKSNVIAQDEQVNEIVTAITLNTLCDDNDKRNHLLITGPVGVGKTQIIKCISEYLNVPCAIVDSTQYTVAGYVRNNIEDMLKELYYKANGNIMDAERGILVIDEIDKKVSDNNHDVSGKGVLNSLLKLMDGATFNLEMGPFHKIKFDTSKLTVICSGAFSDMKKFKGNPIGFVSNNRETEKVTFDDLVEFGMPEKFVGRFSNVITLNNLSKNDLVKILNESNISPIKVKKEFLKKKFDVDLYYDEKYIESIAERGIALKTGARSLKRSVEKSLLKATSEIIYGEGYKELYVTKNTVLDNNKYSLKKNINKAKKKNV